VGHTPEIRGIRPLISAGRLAALMPALRGSALDVTHVRMRSSLRHPRLDPGGLSGRAMPLRAADDFRGAAHCG